jgi:phospholipid/cholesterol/gamma-HCH transport system substrate-binding protein
METRANLIKIGVFVLAVIFAGFAGAFWLLKGDQKGPRTPVAVTFHGTVGGLLPGAAVAYNGIKIGEVTKVEFVRDNPDEIHVELSVDSSAPIRRDSSIGLGFSGLTGYATVQITGGTMTAPLLLDAKSGPAAMTADAGSVQDVMSGARNIMGRADQTLTTIQRVINDAAPSVSKIVKNVETVTTSLADNAKNIDKFLAAVGSAADTLSKVSAKVDTLVDDVDKIATSIDHDKIVDIIANAQAVSKDLAKSSARLDEMVANLNGTIGDARKVVAAIDPVKVSASLDNIAKISQYVGSKTGDVDDIIAHAKVASANIDTLSKAIAEKSPDISQLISNTSSAMQQVELASHRLDPVLAGIDGMVNSKEGRGLFAQGRTFLEAATETAKSFTKTSDTINAKAAELTTTVNQVAGDGLREFRGFVTDSRRALESIDRAVNDFNRNPQQLLFGAKSSVPEYNRK